MSSKPLFPTLGRGLGLRREHYRHVVESRPAIDWFEVITENFMVAGGNPRRVLEAVRQDYPIVLHGVSLSIGSTDPHVPAFEELEGELARVEQWSRLGLAQNRTGDRHAA